MFFRIKDDIINGNDVVRVTGYYNDEYCIRVTCDDGSTRDYYYESISVMEHELDKIEEALCSSK